MDHITLADINYPDCCDIAKLRRIRRLESEAKNIFGKVDEEKQIIDGALRGAIYSKQKLIKILESQVN